MSREMSTPDIRMPARASGSAKRPVPTPISRQPAPWPISAATLATSRAMTASDRNRVRS